MLREELLLFKSSLSISKINKLKKKKRDGLKKHKKLDLERKQLDMRN